MKIKESPYFIKEYITFGTNRKIILGLYDNYCAGPEQSLTANFSVILDTLYGQPIPDITLEKGDILIFPIILEQL
jgi:hypothetical protein